MTPRRIAGFFVAMLLVATTARGLVVRFAQPAAGEPVFGSVEVAVEIVEGTASEVIILLDGREVGRLQHPPYRLRVDVGEGNREHRFEVIAMTADGATSDTAVLVTPAIPVHLEVEVNLMQLYVTVTQQEERVLDLDANDFEILDNGRPQELITFERGDVPLVALLLVDASYSMRGERLQAATRGAGTFIDGLRELDQARLLLFGDRPRHVTPFTSFPEILRTGLDLVTAEGGTALNDHLFLALHQLEERQGRRVVILLSDGIDVTSALPMAEVRETARRSQAMIYWIRLGLPDPQARHASAWRDIESHRREITDLEETVRESGGRILSLPHIRAIPEAFATVLDELREQYVLGYYPDVDQDDQSWHTVDVRLSRRDLDVRTREGYVDD